MTEILSELLSHERFSRTILGTINRQKMQKFEDLMKKNYREHVDEKYDDATKDTLKAIGSDSDVESSANDTDEEEQDSDNCVAN